MNILWIKIVVFGLKELDNIDYIYKWDGWMNGLMYDLCFYKKNIIV